MGIDIYLDWKGMTEAEAKARYTGFSVQHGHVGYLREAYHGGPYVTQFLVREAFEADDAQAKIPAAVMRERLPQAVAMAMAIYREHVVYGEGPRHEVNISKLGDAVASALADAASMKGGTEAVDFKLNAEQTRAALDLIESRELDPRALAFVDFVILAERKEKETGEHCTVVASY